MTNEREFKVLVTGSSGLVGTALQQIVGNDVRWVFTTRSDADLVSYEQTLNLIRKHTPTHVVHLAANVGGLLKNMSSGAVMLYENMTMNFNVIEACRAAGVSNIIGILSSCIFPDGFQINTDTSCLTETLNNGLPHDSNHAYAYAKRMVHVLGKAYNNSYGMNYVSVIPVNIYGNLTPREASCSIEDLHVIPALVRKFTRPGTVCVDIEGDGTPLRQFVHADDVAAILVDMVCGNSKWEDTFISPGNEVSIRDIVEIISKSTGVTFKFNMKSKHNGQMRKYVPHSPESYIFKNIESTLVDVVSRQLG